MAFIMGVTEKYKDGLLKDREMVEGLVIGGLYKNPSLFKEYASINSADFLTEDALYYFGLGKQMSERYNQFDQATIEVFINDNDIIKDGYKARGGFTSIQEIKAMCDINSFDDYLDNLAKNNLILKFYDEGIDATKEVTIEGKKFKPLNLFKKMTANDVKLFYEGRINAISVNNVKQDVIVENLGIDDDFISKCKSGESIGASYSTVLNWTNEDGDEHYQQGLSIMSSLTAGIHKGEVTLLGGYSGLGKALTMDSKLLGANGYMKMRDVKLGDKLFGEDGKLHNVIGVFPQGVKDIYRVTFSDGSTVDCCKEHIWSVKNSDNPDVFVNMNIDDMLRHESLNRGLPMSIPITAPVEFERKNTPISPKVLGLLISGNSFDDKTSLCLDDVVTLRRLNMLDCSDLNIYIPDCFKYNSVDIRLDLLSALLGANNTSNIYNFNTKSKQLSEDVSFLAETLGWLCTSSIYNNDNGVVFNLIIETSANELNRYIKSIKLVGRKEAQCISVDNPSQLYLTNNCIVTHNTSIVFTNMILPFVNQDYKCCVISNEQKSDSFKALLLSYICAVVFKDFTITRRKIKSWNFTPEEESGVIAEAIKFINKNISPKLKFIKLYDYSIESVGNHIKKLAINENFEYFLYDTFKAEDMTSATVHGGMVEDSKYLFQIASKYDVGVLITQQLALHTEGQVSYLNPSVLSSSKAVKEVVSELFLMRRVYNDIELDPKSKYFLNPHKLVKGADGKWSKEALELDNSKQYRLLFLNKTRNGEDDKVVILKFDGTWGIWNELGFASPSRNPLPR